MWTITHALTTDSGFYICAAENGISSIQTNGIVLSISGKESHHVSLLTIIKIFEDVFRVHVHVGTLPLLYKNTVISSQKMMYTFVYGIKIILWLKNYYFILFSLWRKCYYLKMTVLIFIKHSTVQLYIVFKRNSYQMMLKKSCL